MTRPIFFLSDFGTSDTYVGIVKAVILGIAPRAPIIDLTHEIAPQDVRAGALALLAAAPYLPADAVVLAVVDPGVGTDRRAIGVQVGQCTFVGPDNGLLAWAVQELVASMPPTDKEQREQIVRLDRPEFWLPALSATFHGRDLFGPVAAHLAGGARLADLGQPIDSMVGFPFPSPRIEQSREGQIVAAAGSVVHVDRYGNLITSLRAADLPANPRVSIGNETILGIAANYQASGAWGLIALIGSTGLLEIARPNGSAAKYLDASVGASVTVSAAPPKSER